MNETEMVAEPRRRRSNDLSSEAVEEREPPKRGRESTLARIQKLLTEKIREAQKKGIARVAVFTHPSPDPDAIGSMMGIAWLLRKAYEAEVDCYYDGHVSHPQNQRVCNLLDPEMQTYTNCNPAEYCLRISVDTVPAHAACPEGTDFDLVIDHHKEVPNGGFKGQFLNLKAGSACGTVYQIIKQHQASFEEDNDHDSKVATALMVGIATDTDNLTSDDTTDMEHEAYRELFDYRNSTALKQILRYKHPKEWVQARAAVATTAHNRIKDGVLVHGIGYLTGNNRDLIAAVSDEILTWEGVETAVVFAVVDGDRIEGSVRSTNAAIAVPQLCKDLAAGFGQGGGKLGKGAYSYSLGSCACDTEMDDATRDKLWEFLVERETKRVMKVLKK